MTPNQQDLAGAVARFLALRLARPELASALWIGTEWPSLPVTPLRRILRLNTDNKGSSAALMGDLDALPFRDQQFHGVIIDTNDIAPSHGQHAEQLYRVLHERAPLILIGDARTISAGTRHLYGLFRPRRWLSRQVFCQRYSQWPMTRPNFMQNLADTSASIAGFWPGTPRVSVLEKVTPPPSLPGLTQPVQQAITAGMPSASLAHAPVSRLATTVSEPCEF